MTTPKQQRQEEELCALCKRSIIGRGEWRYCVETHYPEHPEKNGLCCIDGCMEIARGGIFGGRYCVEHNSRKKKKPDLPKDHTKRLKEAIDAFQWITELHESIESDAIIRQKMNDTAEEFLSKDANE